MAFSSSMRRVIIIPMLIWVLFTVGLASFMGWLGTLIESEIWSDDAGVIVEGVVFCFDIGWFVGLTAGYLGVMATATIVGHVSPIAVATFWFLVTCFCTFSVYMVTCALNAAMWMATVSGPMAETLAGVALGRPCFSKGLYADFEIKEFSYFDDFFSSDATENNKVNWHRFRFRDKLFTIWTSNFRYLSLVFPPYSWCKSLPNRIGCSRCRYRSTVVVEPQPLSVPVRYQLVPSWSKYGANTVYK